jgi:hypothetical protein
MIGIRPSTLRRLKQAQHSRVSPLHVSIAGMSYMRDMKDQQFKVKEKDNGTCYVIIRPEDRIRGKVIEK